MSVYLKIDLNYLIVVHAHCVIGTALSFFFFSLFISVPPGKQIIKTLLKVATLKSPRVGSSFFVYRMSGVISSCLIQLMQCFFVLTKLSFAVCHSEFKCPETEGME